MRSLFIFLIPLLALGIGQVTKSFAAEIEISKAWLRASIGQSSVTAGYFTMQNISDQDDRLKGGNPYDKDWRGRYHAYAADGWPYHLSR